MRRGHQLVFVVSLLGLCWYGMMAVHELGHVIGAIVTRGAVQRVVLHPLSISRTEVAPNPQPGWVVWLGPILGVSVPLVLLGIIPRRLTALRSVAGFFAGFCLIANGSYIALGSFDRVGDCGEMLRTGTPLWAMMAFGAVTIAPGLWLWHRLGSPREFVETPLGISARAAYMMAGMLIALLAAGFVFSPQ